MSDGQDIVRLAVRDACAEEHVVGLAQALLESVTLDISQYESDGCAKVEGDLRVGIYADVAGRRLSLGGSSLKELLTNFVDIYASFSEGEDCPGNIMRLRVIARHAAELAAELEKEGRALGTILETDQTWPIHAQGR